MSWSRVVILETKRSPGLTWLFKLQAFNELEELCRISMPLSRCDRAVCPQPACDEHTTSFHMSSTLWNPLQRSSLGSVSCHRTIWGLHCRGEDCRMWFSFNRIRLFFARSLASQNRWDRSFARRVKICRLPFNCTGRLYIVGCKAVGRCYYQTAEDLTTI